MEESSPPNRTSNFPVTQWTVIIDTVSANPDRAREALEKLCLLYRQPMVNWFRRKDFCADPEDLTHAFIAHLLEKSLISKVVPRTGKFRCFLATAMQKFMWDTWDRAGTQKRGGGIEKVPLVDNDVDVEAETSTDSQLDADFAISIHRKVMDEIAVQECLKPYIFQKESSEGWDEIAARVGKTPTAIRKEVSRVRRKHWERFRDEVAQIVAPAAKVEETRYLYELLFKNLPPD